MADKTFPQTKAEPQRIKLTARLSLQAYDAISEIQRQHRHQTGKTLPLWSILYGAVIAYAQTYGIKAGE